MDKKELTLICYVKPTNIGGFFYLVINRVYNCTHMKYEAEPEEIKVEEEPKKEEEKKVPVITDEDWEKLNEKGGHQYDWQDRHN